MNDEPAFPFSHAHPDQLALPLGGIGTGCVCLNGIGGLQDFSLRHRPSTSACPPPGAHREDAAFAILRVNHDAGLTRLLEGPVPPGKVYNQGVWTCGMDTNRAGHEGLPRMERCNFSSGYPFGRACLSDSRLPVEVALLGWNPFIPLDADNSGIPCAILEYRITNVSAGPVDYEFSYHLGHLAVGAIGGERQARSRVLGNSGILFSNSEPEGSDSFGSASLTVIGRPARIKASWLKGGWFDAISALWREVSTGTFVGNDGSDGAGIPGRRGGSVLVSGRIEPGGSEMIPVVITWHFPNSSLRAYGWSDRLPPEHVPAENAPAWRPHYAGQWRDAAAVAVYVQNNYASLRDRTVAFQQALFSSTLQAEVLDAVSANLAILKSPTILRQENGNVWAWEGCCADRGSCSGTCTHVWNYAQSLPHLFPMLERTLREQELGRSLDERGHVSFRATLPDGTAPHDGHAAADGQLGGLLKLFRDWQISGDTAWLRELYPLAKRSLEYCIRTWDPAQRGCLSEPHHNTYDIEFWGPNGMTGTIYLGALCAMREMAMACGAAADAEGYGRLAVRAARFLEDELFENGIFVQKVKRGENWEATLAERLQQGEEDEETSELLRKEGPKYQYGAGCLSDGVIGSWMAALYGVETPADRGKIREHLRNVFVHNFRASLKGHANTQRFGYATEDEGGLLLCSWPRGDKPTLPFIYSDEVWTGIEYQVASHMALEGFTEESSEIVRAVRKRYDGRIRNPWNEYECGGFYARAMASYALLAAWSGFRYSAVTKTLWFSPRVPGGDFRTFFCAASGFGVISLAGRVVTVSMIEGTLEVYRLEFGEKSGRSFCEIRKAVAPGEPLTVELPEMDSKSDS